MLLYKRRFFWRRTLGTIGERLTATLYSWLWFTIIERNWRCSTGEIDLLAVRARKLHLIEVKTKVVRGNRYGAIDQITEQKVRRLRRLLRRYCISNGAILRQRRIASYQIDYVGIEIFLTPLPRMRITRQLLGRL
jgi:putative endonuclease